MNEHDDETTTDVDPDWLAAIRAEIDAHPNPATDSVDRSQATPDDDDPDRWREEEPSWDAEATVGVTSGLLDRIRDEIATGSAPPPAPARPTTGGSPDTVEQPETVEPDVTSHGTPAASPPPPPTAPPARPPAVPATPVAPVPVTDVDVSTTVRWEPRQRLSASAPIKDESAVTDTTHHVGLDRTKVAIALIVAATLLVVVWLLVRDGGDGGNTPPAGSTPTVTVEGGSAPTATATP